MRHAGLMYDLRRKSPKDYLRLVGGLERWCGVGAEEVGRELSLAGWVEYRVLIGEKKGRVKTA